MWNSCLRVTIHIQKVDILSSSANKNSHKLDEIKCKSAALTVKSLASRREFCAPATGKAGAFSAELRAPMSLALWILVMRNISRKPLSFEDLNEGRFMHAEDWPGFPFLPRRVDCVIIAPRIRHAILYRKT
jgi:hypothetical protein